MQITVSIDAAKPLALLRNGGKRMAYAVVNAINHTAKQIQIAERARVAAEFTVRKREFLVGEKGVAAVIRAAGGGSGFASVGKQRFEARISVGQKPRLFLADFESGGQRRPFKGKRVAVPLTGGPARPSFGASVPEGLTFRGMGLRKVGSGRKRRRSRGSLSSPASKPQVKGAHRTFLLKSPKSPHGAVFQRVGPGPGGIRLAYTFVPAPRLARRLRFIATGQAVANRVYAAALQREVEAAFSYALLGVKR